MLRASTFISRATIFKKWCSLSGDCQLTTSFVNSATESLSWSSLIHTVLGLKTVMRMSFQVFCYPNNMTVRTVYDRGSDCLFFVLSCDFLLPRSVVHSGSVPLSLLTLSLPSLGAILRYCYFPFKTPLLSHSPLKPDSLYLALQPDSWAPWE